MNVSTAGLAPNLNGPQMLANSLGMQERRDSIAREGAGGISKGLQTSTSVAQTGVRVAVSSDSGAVGSGTANRMGYQVQAGDTLATVAEAIWGDARNWYLLADINGMKHGADDALSHDMTLTVPYVANGEGAFKPYARDKLVILDPVAMPEVVPPPARKLGWLSLLVQAVVTVAITVLAAPLGPVGWVLGGVIGDAAGQMVSMLANNEGIETYNWQRTLIAGAVAGAAGFASALTPGLNAAMQTSMEGGNYLAAAAYGGTINAMSQGVSLLRGAQQSFDVGAMAGAASAAAVGAYKGANGKPVAMPEKLQDDLTAIYNGGSTAAEVTHLGINIAARLNAQVEEEGPA